ncbi:MAG: HDIG domain-containing protein [Candidatus Kapabacteria bacterium]|nr:HDIG domain-containing protein [Candidatus Kapabacteria bacterium]
METPTLFARLQKRLQTGEEGEGLRYSLGLRVLLVGFVIALCGLFFPWWREEVPPEWYPRRVEVGTRWQGPIVRAEYSFVVRKPTEVYERELQQALEGLLPVFFWRPYRRVELEQRVAVLVDSLYRDTLAAQHRAALSDELLKLIQEEHLRQIHRTVVDLLAELMQRDILNVPKGSLPAQQIAVRRSPVMEQVASLDQVLDSAEAAFLLKALVERRVPLSLQQLTLEVSLRALRPTLFYERELTEAVRQAVRQALPRTWGIVQAGEVIIAPGDIVTDTTIAKLRSYTNARLLQQKPQVSISTLMGSFGHAALICSVLFVYLGFLRPRIFRDNLQLAGLGLGLICIAALAWLSRTIPAPLPLEYLIVLPALSMSVAILLDSRTAFYVTVTASLLVAGVRQEDYPTGLMLMLGGMLAAYTVRDLESRRQLFRSMFFTFLGMGVVTLVFGVAQESSPESLLLHCGLVGLNAAVSPVLTFGVLLILERAFNVATDMRLLEYSSLEHPLMRELQHKAPGTYQHTLNVARLAEQAARAIKARVLLVRVGAYFHDVGKLTKPEYFTENQIGLDNKHDRLPPKKSAAIIREHVIEGIELARSYGLPSQIIDFIPQHHGTMLIRVFWQKAVEQARKRNEPPPNEEDFRYFGPKPQTKEAALLMLADAAEALTHALPADEPERLATALDEIIRERILDGQFDEAPLSFRELQRARDALLEGMVGIQHRRVPYGTVHAASESSSYSSMAEGV